MIFFYINSEIIQSATYDNYDDFQHVNFIFSQKFISLFWKLFNDKFDFRVRYIYLLATPINIGNVESCVNEVN
jgi:hypothetical protein